MRFFCLALFYFVTATVATAQTAVAARTLRTHSIIGQSDIVLLENFTPGAFAKISDVVGKETRSIIYPGRPIFTRDIGPPSVVKRNEIVSLVYRNGFLAISAEGRALARGGIGEQIKVMNISSRTTVVGIVSGPGIVRVSR